MNIDFSKVLDMVAKAPVIDNWPNSYTTDPQRIALARVPTAFEATDTPELDRAFMKSQVPYSYDLRVREDSIGFPTPHFDNHSLDLHLLPTALYDDLHNYTWSLAHELAHASCYYNPAADRPKAMRNGRPNYAFDRGVEEAQADLTALLVLDAFGTVKSRDVDRVVSYAAGWLTDAAAAELQFIAIMAGHGFQTPKTKQERLQEAAEYAKRSAEWIIGLAA